MTSRLYIQFADNDNIRKWQREPFEGGTEYIALSSPASKAESGWRPIETAPKDRLIDVWAVGYGTESHRVSGCYYDRICDEWRTSRPSGHLMCIKARYVTHWMPLPTPPSASNDGEEK